MVRSGMSNQRNNFSRWESPHLLDMPKENSEPEISLEELRNQAIGEGFANGLAEGNHHAQQILQQKMAELDAMLNAIASPYADLNQQVLDSLVLLSSKIARSLVKRELHTHPDTIMALVRDTVAILNLPAATVNVHLHPEDARLIHEIIGSSTEKRWIVIDDPMIARGDCKVSHQDSLIDGNLASRINTVITQFQGDERG
jgi:flagellar assembly protein FliH